MKSVSHKIAAVTTKCVVEENTRKQEIDGNWTNPPLQNVSARKWFHQICLYKMLTGKSLDSESNDPESTTKCFLKKYDDTILYTNKKSIHPYKLAILVTHNRTDWSPQNRFVQHTKQQFCMENFNPDPFGHLQGKSFTNCSQTETGPKKYPNRGTNRE